MKPIALVRNEPPEDFGLVADQLRRDDVPLVEVDGWKLDFPDIGEVSALAVFGGDQHIWEIDQHPDLQAERDLMAEAVDLGVPVLGICLGSQLLAAATGGRVRPAERRQCRFAPFYPTEAGASDPLFSVFAAGDLVFHWHEDTWDLPDLAQLLSSSDQVPSQSFRIGNAWGSQFHFEVTEEALDSWLDAAGPELPTKWGVAADQIREEARRHLGRQQEQGRQLIRRFARLSASAG